MYENTISSYNFYINFVHYNLIKCLFIKNKNFIFNFINNMFIILLNRLYTNDNICDVNAIYLLILVG